MCCSSTSALAASVCHRRYCGCRSAQIRVMILPNRALFLACCLLCNQLNVEGLLAVSKRVTNSVFCRQKGRFHAPRIYMSSSVADSVTYLRDNLQTPPEALIRAVEKAGPNTPLSVGDAAALSGTDLNTARTNLMILSTLTGGDLEVTKDGEILYSFPSGVRSVLERRSLGQKIKVSYKIMYPYLLFALRASFGIFLFTSLAILVGTFVAVSTSSSSNSDDRDRGGNNRRGNNNILFNLPSLGDGLLQSFYYRPYYGYYQTSGYRPDYTQKGQPESDQKGVSFIESFFSYVFGDGDPNAEFSNDQLKFVAAKIRASGGMVVADQLGPYLDPPDLKITSNREYDGSAGSVDSYIVDESWVLPAVLQLGGVPVVTEDGNIVYQFQDLVTSGSASTSNVINGGKLTTATLPSLLLEKEIPFSAASAGMKIFAGGLGIANFIGALWLGRLLGSATMLAREPILMASLSKIYPALFLYAMLYNIIPAVRWFFIKKKNEAVKLRNLRRERWAAYVLKEPQSLKEKIASGRAAVGRETLERLIRDKSGASTAYSTKEDQSNVERNKREFDSFKEFDRKLQ